MKKVASISTTIGRSTSTAKGASQPSKKQKPANRGAAAEEPSPIHIEPRTPNQHVTITREAFFKQISPFKTSNSKFHQALIQVFDNDSSLRELILYFNQIGDEGS